MLAYLHCLLLQPDIFFILHCRICYNYLYRIIFISDELSLIFFFHLFIYLFILFICFIYLQVERELVRGNSGNGTPGSTTSGDSSSVQTRWCHVMWYYWILSLNSFTPIQIRTILLDLIFFCPIQSSLHFSFFLNIFMLLKRNFDRHLM